MRRTGAGMLIIVVVVACSGIAMPTPTPRPSVVLPSAMASSASATSPATPAAPTTTIAPAPSPPVPTPSLAPTEAPTIVSAEPPAAVMAMVGLTEQVQGEHGSYTYAGLAVDAPWLPARILHDIAVPAGARLTVRFKDGTSIAGWHARYAAAADEQALVLHSLRNGGLVDGAVEVVAPPIGDWVVNVSLDYPAEQGSGSYFWHVTVTP